MSGFRYEKDSDKIVTITMDMPGQPVNTMSAAFHVYLKETIETLKKDDISGVILTSGKETFFAGGDLNGILAYTPALKEERFERSMSMKTRLRCLETLGVPVVAAINGAALGGGYEICQCTHHRIALKNPKSLIGLPEVTLGLLPGGGGVTRLPRMLGLEKALPLLLEGTKFAPEKALEAGLVDVLAEDREDLMAKAKAWIEANPDARQPWDVKGYKMPGGDPSHPKVKEVIRKTLRLLRKKARGLYPAPEAIMAAVVECAQVDIETALRIESRYFLDVIATPVAKNLITNFFQTNKIKSGVSRPQGFEKFKVRKVGILGAGKMGAGIAYSVAKAGIEVVLKDTSLAKAETGKDYSVNLLDKQPALGRMTEENKAALLSKITATAEVKDLANCDLIIEAVFEDAELKFKVIQETEPFLTEIGFFASNTSSLPIGGLAGAAKDAARFIGLHFFSPVDKMSLAEIICGEKTSDETLARAFDFIQQIKKTPIVVNDSLGFYTSRVFSTFIDEGCALLLDGVDPLLIDNMAKLAGMQVGPLNAQDEVSQQFSTKIMSANRKLTETTDGVWVETARESVLKIVTGEHGRLGKAYNGGFYDYAENDLKRIWPMLYELFGQKNVQIDDDEIKDRLLFRQVIEAVKCLEEGVLRSVAECNIGSVLGIGFPPHTGGQLQYINTYGLEKFVSRAKELAQKYGQRFEPPALLLEKAEKGEGFA